MARYWVYINNEVAGPYAVDQLIRLRGFSRQTPVCEDDTTGTPTHWISLGEIPELAHIFKAADERHAEPVAVPKPKTSPKAAPVRARRPFVPAVMLAIPKASGGARVRWGILAIIVAGCVVAGVARYKGQNQQVHDLSAARMLIESVRLPSTSRYGSLPQYFEAKGIRPDWRLEKLDDGLYRVSLSWYSASATTGAPVLTVYAFEVNTQAQTVRGLNSAASTILTEGFPSPASAKPKEAAPKKSPAAIFAPALDSHLQALASGDSQAIWGRFSRRKKAEMAKAGISYDGYSRVQKITHRVESAKTRQLMKTKQNSETEMLALIKESQAGHPDVFVKQLWVLENESWKLDDEQKKSDAAVTTTDPSPSPTRLPGMAN